MTLKIKGPFLIGDIVAQGDPRGTYGDFPPPEDLK
jgi:hypothetical protein